MTAPNWANCAMWTGDNLDIMRGMNSESVDLIYLDPPFNANRAGQSLYARALCVDRIWNREIETVSEPMPTSSRAERRRLAQKLPTMLEEAPVGKMSAIHRLFGVRFARALSGMNLYELDYIAGMGVESKKRRNLAPFVAVKSGAGAPGRRGSRCFCRCCRWPPPLQSSGLWNRWKRAAAFEQLEADRSWPNL